MKRYVLGGIWFVVFLLGSRVIAGMIIGAQAGSHLTATDAESTRVAVEAGRQAALTFFEHWGLFFLLGALVAAIVGTITGFLPGTRKPAQ